LSPIRKEVTTKRAGLTFHLGLSRKISNIMAKHVIQMVPEASGKLSQVLESPKDVVDERAKSGIYEIQCETCPMVYYRQTRQSIDERFKEHMLMVGTMAEEKSSEVKNLLNNPGHVITLEDLSLVKKVDRHGKIPRHFSENMSEYFLEYVGKFPMDFSYVDS
jgi:hypothetical protein